MSWQSTLYLFPLLATATISLAIALYAWYHREKSGIVALAFLMVTITIWSIAYALELSSNELQLKMLFTNIEYIGITLLPVAWLALAFEFSGYDSWLTPRRFSLLVIMPIITMMLVWTNDYHNLIYKDAWIDFSQGYSALKIVQGQWYWVNVAYSYVLVFVATLLVIEAFIRSTKLHRKQALVLLIGALIPWIANLIYMMGWNPIPFLDLTPLAFLISGIAGAIGLFYFGLLDIMPVARNIVIENMPEGIIVLDDNNRILDMNSAAINMTGLNINQSLGQSASDLLSWLLAPIENLLESSSSCVETCMEKEVLAERGNQYYNLSVSAIYGMRGDLKARILLIKDITALKKAEIMHKECEETAWTLLNAPLDAACLLDEKGIFLALNKAAACSLGKDIEDLRGTYAFDLFSPDVRQKRKEYVEEVLRSGKPIQFEDERAGRHFNHSIHPILNPEGKATKVAIFIKDITECKHAEYDLRKAKEMAESASRAKSNFLANMSHEIRTPLNAVIGLTGLLLQTNLNYEQKEYLETIRNSGESLLSVINDILDFSKIDIGKMKLELRPFDLKLCIDESIKLITPYASEKGINLIQNIDPNTPEFIVGDQIRLRQILVNLLNNAVKFTDNGEVAISVISQRLDASDCEIHFAIKDTGIGIPQEKIGHLFQSFNQLDPSITRRYGGTGLGLAISKRLVELMEGKIWVESEVGKGSVFHFTIAAKAVTKNQINALMYNYNRESQTASPLIGQHSMRILLAEDNVINQKVALQMLKKIGCTADIASNGKEVLSALELQSYDLVLMDVQMPEMDGLEAARIIRERYMDGPKIIALTAYALDGDRDRCLDVGMDDYISKPIQLEELRIKLIKWGIKRGKIKAYS